MQKASALIDTHCHLEEVRPLDAALNAAKDAGVFGIIAVGQNFDSNRLILDISRKENPVKVYPALGLHPGNVTVDNIEKNILQIKENIPNIVAIGETGLDFWISPARKDASVRDLQVKAFKAQIELAKQYNLPMSVHTRGAWCETFEIAHKEKLKKCVFHWYTGSLKLLDDIIKTGYYISVTPALEYSVQLIDAARHCPLDRILLESDSPVTYKPKTGIYRSEPKDTIRAAEALAGIKEKSVEEVIKICNNTARNLFLLGG